MLNLQLLSSRWFKILIPVCICVNTLVLASDRYPIDKNHEFAIEIANQLFFLIFTIEMFIKLIGLGCKGYLRNQNNIFDGVIIILSTFDFILFLMSQEFFKAKSETSDVHARSMTFFRIFRLLRVFRLGNYYNKLNFFLQTLGRTIIKIVPFVILVIIFIFMYAIVGMELFANTLRFDRNNKSIEYYDTNAENVSHISHPDSNFDTFAMAMISVFTVFGNGGWTVIYFDCFRVVGSHASLFFISLIVLGQMILRNLFLSILLKEFDQSL